MYSHGRCQIESYRRGGHLGHLDVQESAGSRRFSQLDQMLPRAVSIHGDAFVISVISPILRDYSEDGNRSVTNLLDRHVTLIWPFRSGESPAYCRIRYALGNTGKIDWSLFPRPDCFVQHIVERGRGFHGQMAVLVGDAAFIFRHAFVQAIVISENINDRESANGLTGYVIHIVLHDDSVVSRLSAHHVWLVDGELPEGHLGWWSAKGLAVDIHVFAFYHGFV